MKIRKEVKVGLFALIVLVVTFFTVDFLKGRDIFSSNKEVVTFIESVDGLAPSTILTLQGYRIGEVSSIEYDNDTRMYEMVISMSNKYKIPSDSRFEVYGIDILGSKGVRVVLGNSSDQVKSGDTLAISAVPDMISSIVSEIGPTKQLVDSLLTAMNQTVSSINMILDEESVASVRKIVSDVSIAVKDISMIAASLKGSVPNVESLISNLDTLTSSLVRASSSLEGVTANAQDITLAVKESGITEAVTSLKELLSKIQDPGSSVGKLLTTDSLYNSIHSLSVDLDSLVKKIEENPRKYIKISVF
ncbi:MAG: MlaD family protein [Candidatus Coprenecus sp.]